MSTAWVRDYGNHDADRDASASASSILYIVTGDITPDAVLASPTTVLGGLTGTEGLPAVGSVHPEIPGLILDRYTASGDGAVILVTALYSSNGRFRTDTQPISSETDTRWTTTFIDIVSEVPYTELVSQVLSSATTEQVYVPKFKRMPEKAARHTATGLISRTRYYEALQVLGDERGTLQIINGKYWLFEGGDLNPSPNSRDFYTCSLSYLEEKGLPAVRIYLSFDANGNPTTESTVVAYPILTVPMYGSVQWSRPPYMSVFYEPDSSGDATIVGDYTMALKYPLSRNGFNRVANLFSSPLNPGALPP